MDLESARILQTAQTTFTVTSELGKVIELRKLPRREVMRHMRQWGVACNVESWLALALLAASVSSIDGKPMPPSDTPDRVEMIADMLDTDGLTAVGAWYQEQQEVSTAQSRDAIKN
jgi:hypothetical protein